MKGETLGDLTYVRRGKQYVLKMEGFTFYLGLPDRKFRGKKLFLLPGYALVDAESFIEEFGIIV
jgi:hypothetical protein